MSARIPEKDSGKGTFVEAPKIYRKLEQDNNISFTEACKLNGCTSSSHVISFRIEKIKGENTVSSDRRRKFRLSYSEDSVSGWTAGNF